jgi:glycosyltransferase involved in cell wall biosynthesis
MGTRRSPATRSRKRICIVKHYYYDALVRREAEALQKAGFDTAVVCLGAKSGTRHEVINSVHLHRIPLTREKGSMARYVFDYLSFFFLAACKLVALHLKGPFSCIQVNNMPDFLVFCTLIPRVLGAKVALVMYEPTPELWATKYSTPWLISLLKFVERLSLGYAHRVFAVTDQMRQVFVGRGCPERKVQVILNSPDTSIFGNDTPAQVEHKGLILICHGAIEKRYGHDTMLQAINLVKGQIPEIQLRITGSGSYLTEFLARIAEMGLENHVHYLGFLPFNELVGELRNADIGIVAQTSSPYSNLVHTGKMYDYIHFGLPVIASRLAAVQAYFGDHSLYFFEPGNPESLAQAILDLYHHPDKRKQLIVNSRQLYDESYCWDKQKEIYLSTYRSLVGER